MKTKILKINKKNIDLNKIEYAANILKQAGTVVFPTETVYGLGANALDEEAVKKIFEAKGRPSDNPLIVHVSKIEDIKDLAENIPDSLYVLSDKFWPGPLTVILKKKSIVPDITTGGLDTVAIRIPNNKIAYQIIQKSGIPIAAPSANISGRPSATCPEHVIEDLDGRVDVIIDGGSVDVGVESTVLDLTSENPTILRPGIITLEQLKEVFDNISIDKTLLEKLEVQKPLSPGMKYKHYSPNAQVIIIEGEKQKVIDKINDLAKDYQKQGNKIGIMSIYGSKSDYKLGHIINVGNGNLNEVASNLFTVLRQFDNIGVDIILSESVPYVGIGLAIMNRLIKASGYNVIKV